MLKDLLFNIYTHLHWFYIYTPEFYSLIIGVLFTYYRGFVYIAINRIIE